MAALHPLDMTTAPGLDPFEDVTTGAGWHAGLHLSDGNTGQTFPLDGASASMSLRSSAGDETEIASTSDGRMSFPLPGLVVWDVPAAAMADLPPAPYVCTIRVAMQHGEIESGHPVTIGGGK